MCVCVCPKPCYPGDCPNLMPLKRTKLGCSSNFEDFESKSPAMVLETNHWLHVRYLATSHTLWRRSHRGWRLLKSRKLGQQGGRLMGMDHVHRKATILGPGHQTTGNEEAFGGQILLGIALQRCSKMPDLVKHFLWKLALDLLGYENLFQLPQ